MHGHVDRERQLVHRGDIKVRVDEQPLPIERDRLDLERLGAGRNRPARPEALQRTERIEEVRARPGHGAERDDDQERARPDHQLERCRMVELRIVGLVGVAPPVLSGEHHRQHHDRHDDQQHHTCREQDEVALLDGDVAGRVQDHHVAATEQRG